MRFLLISIIYRGNGNLYESQTEEKYDHSSFQNNSKAPPPEAKEKKSLIYEKEEQQLLAKQQQSLELSFSV